MLKRNLRILLPAIVLLLLLPIQVSAAPARIGNNRVHVRSSPSIGDNILFQVNHGDAVEIVARSGDFYRVNIGARRNVYVHRDFIFRDVSIPGVIGSGGAAHFMIARHSMSDRHARDNILGNIPANSQVNITGESPLFYRVVHNNRVGYVYRDSVNISTEQAAHTHIPGAWVTIIEATCSAAGHRERHCIVCGDIVESEAIPVLGHDLTGTWIIRREPACASDGERVQYCLQCNLPGLIEPIPALSHTPSGDWVIYERARCYAPGLRVQYCLVCGGFAEEEPTPPGRHTFTRQRISGNIFIPPIVYREHCIDCGYYGGTTRSFAMAWLLPTIVFVLPGLIVMIILLSVRSAKKDKKFVCPYCFKQHIIKDVQFRCTNITCADVDDIELSIFEGLQINPNNPHAPPPLKRKMTFPVSINKNELPKFAQCPGCGKGTSKTVCPSCHNSLPESVLTGEDKIAAIGNNVSSG